MKTRVAGRRGGDHFDVYLHVDDVDDVPLYDFEAAVMSDVTREIDTDWDISSSSRDDILESAHARDGAEAYAGAFGIHYGVGEELTIGEKERSRDARRWELDPASAEDYANRAHTKARRSKFLR
jgi:hypothetical protein